MEKKKLWLFLSDLQDIRNGYLVPALSWIAEERGVLLECYLEASRNGMLFAQSGSTVIGGTHHSHFNYLCNVFDVSVITLGKPCIFKSTLDRFGIPEIARSDDACGLVRQMLELVEPPARPPVILLSGGFLNSRFMSYIYPEILFRKAICIPLSDWTQDLFRGSELFLFMCKGEVLPVDVEAKAIDEVEPTESMGEFTLRLANRWKKRAKGVAFGDHDAIASQLAHLCRKKYVPLFGELVPKHNIDIIADPYTENTSLIASEVAELALEIGNPVIIGRQTGDGDLLEWSKNGVCIEIMDPNRPTFPIIETISQPWAIKSESSGIFDFGPDDTVLEKWIEEKKILTTIMVHSGEMAHNEAVANLFETMIFKGFKMGIGVHAARYKTMPQIFELLSIPESHGGVLGYAEPVLHCGGRGVLAECNCPPQKLTEHCAHALEEIGEICGSRNMPKGYMSFMDSDFPSFRSRNNDIYAAVEKAGLDYYISNACPGRNAVLYHGPAMIALNQTTRKLYWGSPFVRSSTYDDVRETSPNLGPGWLVTTIDAPVIAFNRYIWEKGSNFFEMLDYMRNNENFVNVTPSVISRYARMLEKKKLVPSMKQ